MQDVIEQLKENLSERRGQLAEAKAEVLRLERALSALGACDVQREDAPAGLSLRGGDERKVVAYITEHGPASKGGLAEQLGIGEQRIGRILMGLCKRGHLARVHRGVYGEPRSRPMLLEPAKLTGEVAS